MSVPHALLALLSEGPKYGLQLREEFEARTGEVWPLNVGQVYKTLGQPVAFEPAQGLVQLAGSNATGWPSPMMPRRRDRRSGTRSRRSASRRWRPG